MAAGGRAHVPALGRAVRVHPQDDGFLEPGAMGLRRTPEENYPLLLYYHPLNLYRNQVIKQADTVLAMFLLGDSSRRARSSAFRLLRSAHDPRLLAFRLHPEHRRQRDRLRTEGARLFPLCRNDGPVRHRWQRDARRAHRLDRRYLDGPGLWLRGNARPGGCISFQPRLPAEWSRLRFALAVRGQRLRVEARHDFTTYSLVEGDDLAIVHDGEAIRLTAEARTATRANPSPLPEPAPDFAPRP